MPTNYTPFTKTSGDQFTAPEATEMSQQIDEEETINVAQQATIDALVIATRSYTHTQSTPAATWTITHTLGRRPASVSIWLADELVYADVAAPSTSSVVITFPSPIAGRAEIR
jgi:hypothetical protein